MVSTASCLVSLRGRQVLRLIRSRLSQVEDALGNRMREIGGDFRLQGASNTFRRMYRLMQRTILRSAGRRAV